MTYVVTVAVEAFHKPTKNWFIRHATHDIRAVSRKVALNKGLDLARRMNAYTERANDSEWDVTIEAKILD